MRARLQFTSDSRRRANRFALSARLGLGGADPAEFRRRAAALDSCGAALIACAQRLDNTHSAKFKLNSGLTRAAVGT